MVLWHFLMGKTASDCIIDVDIEIGAFSDSSSVMLIAHDKNVSEDEQTAIDCKISGIMEAVIRVGYDISICLLSYSLWTKLTYLPIATWLIIFWSKFSLLIHVRWYSTWSFLMETRLIMCYINWGSRGVLPCRVPRGYYWTDAVFNITRGSTIMIQKYMMYSWTTLCNNHDITRENIDIEWF